MAREFEISVGGITLANQLVTLVFINPKAAPNFSLEILRCYASQTGTATSAQQRMQFSTQVTAFPTLTSTTPQPLITYDPNASIIVGGTAGAAGTCGTNASAEGGGAKTSIKQEAFNNLNGYLWVPTPRETIKMPAGGASGFGMVFPVAPGTLTNWSFGLVYGEV